MPYSAEGHDRSSFMLNEVADISEINTRDWRFLERIPRFVHRNEADVYYRYVHVIYERITLCAYYERYDNNMLCFTLTCRLRDGCYEDVDSLEEAIEMIRLR